MVGQSVAGNLVAWVGVWVVGPSVSSPSCPPHPRQEAASAVGLAAEGAAEASVGEEGEGLAAEVGSTTGLGALVIEEEGSMTREAALMTGVRAASVTAAHLAATAEGLAVVGSEAVTADSATEEDLEASADVTIMAHQVVDSGLCHYLFSMILVDLPCS